MVFLHCVNCCTSQKTLYQPLCENQKSLNLLHLYDLDLRILKTAQEGTVETEMSIADLRRSLMMLHKISIQSMTQGHVVEAVAVSVVVVVVVVVSVDVAVSVVGVVTVIVVTLVTVVVVVVTLVTVVVDVVTLVTVVVDVVILVTVVAAAVTLVAAAVTLVVTVVVTVVEAVVMRVKWLLNQLKRLLITNTLYFSDFIKIVARLAKSFKLIKR